MARRQLRILCFGDSLTSGYFSFGMDSRPYALKLEDKLTGALPNVDVKITISGVPGDVATFERFAQRFIKQYDKEGPFDWVIVLGGTNDLAYGISAGKIFESLQRVWNLAISRGSKVLALTVPETEIRAERLVGRRDELNLGIMTHQQENFYFFDLESQIPFHALSQEDRKKYWDDGVHLRDEGYDWMGEHIANALLRFLSRDDERPAKEPGQPANKSKSRTTNDSLTFDEESGNPKNINQGYIVVRKSDLE